MRSFLMKWDSNRYRNLGLAQECDWQDLLHIDGRHWTGRNSFDAIFIDDERRKRRLLEGDFPSFSTTLPVFSDRARRLIEDLITPGGEWIRLNTGTGPFWGLNIT